MGHLTPEQIVDVAEGVVSETPDLSAALASHLKSCRACRERLEDVRVTLSAVAGVSVPEPSPLFWDRLSARVHDAVNAERETLPSGFRRWSWPRTSAWWVAATAIAVLVIAVGLRLGRTPEPAPLPAAATRVDTSAAVEALGTVDDPSLSLVADLAADLDWETAREAGFTTHVGVDDDALNLLTDSERYELHQLLKTELGRRGISGA